ncbi:MAG: TetR/AcrR family transcriptional regulator [Myxococcales bacterium]|nr:TetR/AcrR family transcriptional regulator [Myxococcales bacterium]
MGEDGTKRPRGRPPIPDDVQRRRLVTAAIRVFSQKPYDGARIADIVQEAKMSSRSFYQFFESKEDVVVEVIHAVMGAFLRNLEAVFAATEDPIERIDRGTAAALEIFVGATLDLHALGGAAGARATEARTHYVRRISAMITRELGLAHERGQVAAPPDPAAVELLVTGVEGVGLRFMAEGRSEELRRLHPVLMGLLVRAFVGESGSSL